MAKIVHTTYSCDRCGGDANYAACRGDPPHAEVYFAFGLYGSGGPEKAKFRDLCRGCYDELQRWFSGTRPPQPK